MQVREGTLRCLARAEQLIVGRVEVRLQILDPFLQCIIGGMCWFLCYAGQQVDQGPRLGTFSDGERFARVAFGSPGQVHLNSSS